MTITKKYGQCGIGTTKGERNIGKTIAVEVGDHSRTNCWDTALRNRDRSAESTFAVTEKNLQLGAGASKDIEMAVTIEVGQPNSTCGAS